MGSNAKPLSRTRVLFALGDPRAQRGWHDYLRYGLDASDVPALLALVEDESLGRADGDSNEVWVPLHAWRALGQIGNPGAIAPLIEMFESLSDDDWALEELPKVMGMIGEPAIVPLTAYLKDSQREEFARVIASDSLLEIVQRHCECREAVIRAFRETMRDPDEASYTLNGLLISNLMDLGADETIDDIRELFENGFVDESICGDLEDVEIAFGLRVERSTPKQRDLDESLSKIRGSGSPASDLDDTIDDYLARFGNDVSIRSAAELNGFFAALACSPSVVVPSRWMPAIWSGESRMPERWRKEDVESFFRAAISRHNEIMDSTGMGHVAAFFGKREVDGEIHVTVEDWSDGFLRGFELWGRISGEDANITEECIGPIRLLSSRDESARPEDKDGEEVQVEAFMSIEPGVRRLYQYFYERRPLPGAPIVRESPKIGRNDPCPCGSGKKYKKCCLQ